MAVTAWTGAGSVTENNTAWPGGGVWNNLANAQGLSNGVYATGSPGIAGGTWYDDHVHIYNNGGVNTAYDLANGQFTNADVDKDWYYGGDGELWGIDFLTPDIINGTAFGFYFKPTFERGLYASQYGFAIPANAIITGFEIRVRVRRQTPAPSYSNILVDSIEARVFYTTDYLLTANGTSSGYVFGGEVRDQVKLDKRYQFKIYDRGTFLGEWDELANEPEFKEQINTIGTQLPVKLGRAIDSLDPVPFGLTDETGDDLLSQDGDNLFAIFKSGKGLGEGSDADVNYDVNVNAYYGGYDYLVTQDFEELVTQDFELFTVQEGAPEGRSLFNGFISQWQSGYSGDDAINAVIMSYGWELNQYMVETADTASINLTASPTNTRSFDGSFYAYVNTHLFQTFTAPAAGNLSRITVRLHSNFANGANCTLTLKTGTTPNAGTVLATSTITVAGNGVVSDYDFAFAEAVALTSGAGYHFQLTTTSSKGSSSGNDALTAYMASANYTGGVFYSQSNTETKGGTQLNGPNNTEDLYFKTWYSGGQTTVTFNSTDPSVMLTTILDRIAAKGSHVTYDATTILPTGSVASYTFKSMTVAEAIDKILELAPADWYYYFDPATNKIHFKPRPTIPDHTFTLGRDIASFDIKRNMEDIKNEVYFSGGGNPALFVKQVDAASQTTWRKGLAKLSDNRVTVQASAETIAQGHIDRNKEPQYTVTMTIAAALYDIESISVGHLVNYRGFDNFIDDLVLQISEKTYRRDTATLVLGTVRPAVSKRLEDIRRNLDTLEQQNNPASPV